MKTILELVIIGYFVFLKADDLFENEKTENPFEIEKTENLFEVEKTENPFEVEKTENLFKDEKTENSFEDEINYNWTKSYFDNVTLSSKLNLSRPAQNKSIPSSGKFLYYIFYKMFYVNLFLKVLVNRNTPTRKESTTQFTETSTLTASQRGHPFTSNNYSLIITDQEEMNGITNKTILGILLCILSF